MASHSAAERTDEILQLNELRVAIQGNRVSFPVPVPVFARQYRADIQWRLAELYLIHGWTPLRLAERYKISRTRVRQSVRSWVRRARTLGYLQPVPADTGYPVIQAHSAQAAYLPVAPMSPTAWSSSVFARPEQLRERI